MYVCMCVYACVYVCVCICMYGRPYLFSVRVCPYVHVCGYEYVYVYVTVYVTVMCTCMCSCMHGRPSLPGWLGIWKGRNNARADSGAGHNIDDAHCVRPCAIPPPPHHHHTLAYPPSRSAPKPQNRWHVLQVSCFGFAAGTFGAMPGAGFVGPIAPS